MIDRFIALLVYLIITVGSGALFGLIPLYLGRYTGKPNLGRLAFKWCTGLNVLAGAGILAAIGFVSAIIIRDRDYFPNTAYVQPSPPPAFEPYVPPRQSGSRLGVTCLSGPLRGQTYNVGPNGVIIGRDHDCGIRFASDAPGISRHHCSLRYQQGGLSLTDLNSAYGTFLADGRRLPAQYPTQMAAGTRFYLANTDYLFQIVITG